MAYGADCPEQGYRTYVFGGTLVPGWMMPGFYGPVGRRLAEGGRVSFHAMAPRGGLGRTDHIVESFLPMLDAARGSGAPVRLAGHSLGGVVAWVLAHEYADIVDTVEIWGAPVRGTAIAQLLRHLGAEARFLSPGSRYLARYDRPLNGPRVRSVYTACDLLVTPPRESSFVEGERAENHYLVPYRLHPRDRRTGERVHTGWAEHLLLPRHRPLLANVA